MPSLVQQRFFEGPADRLVLNWYSHADSVPVWIHAVPTSSWLYRFQGWSKDGATFVAEYHAQSTDNAGQAVELLKRHSSEVAMIPGPEAKLPQFKA